MKCTICWRARCIWVPLKPNPGRMKTERLQKVLRHNGGYIDMLARQGNLSENGESRMLESLGPYEKELEKRKNDLPNP